MRLGVLLSTLLRDVLVNAVIGSGLVARPLRTALMRALGYDLHPLARLNAHCRFYGAWRRLTVGRRTFVNYGCVFDLAAPITLGDDVAVGFEAAFLTSSHELGPATQRAGRRSTKPIMVGDGCWIGARAVLLQGVELPAGTVIAAGSVVVESPDQPGVYAGVPARLVRHLPEQV